MTKENRFSILKQHQTNMGELFMKKLLALLLALALMLTFVACGTKDDDDDDDDRKPKSSNKGDKDDDDNKGGIFGDKDDDDDQDKDKDSDQDKDDDDDDSSDSSKIDGVVESIKPNGGFSSDNSAIEDYINENKASLIAEMEQGLAASGLSCKTDIEAEGAGFKVYIYINELENVDDQTKANLQEVYDTMSDTYELLLKNMQKQIDGLEYFQYILCDRYGDELAVITAGNP